VTPDITVQWANNPELFKDDFTGVCHMSFLNHYEFDAFDDLNGLFRK
jgi:hypothetical protein